MNAGKASERPLRPWLIAVSIMLATVMQIVDMSIAFVALPHMQGSLSTTQEQISWVLTSYIIAAAIATPATGFIASRFGRRRVFLISVFGFTLASMMCGAAATLPQLIAFRVLQGVLGAGLVPFSQALLLDTFPREKHAQAMAFWGVGVMVGPILGPTLGGYLTEVYSWRWVFYINMPVGILAFLGILAFVPESRREGERPFDWFGFFLLAVSLGMLQLVLDRGHLRDWFSSTEIIIEASLAALCFYMFVVHMFTARRPFFDPAIFKDHSFVGGLSFMLLMGMVTMASLLLLPPFLQNLKDYPVITTGLVLAPRGVGTIIATLIVARIINHTDPRLLILTGLLLISASLWQMAGFSLDVSALEVVNTGILQGFGLGCFFVPLTTMTFSTLAPMYRNEASALFSLARMFGSSVGISVVVTLLARNTQINHATLSENLTPFNQVLGLRGVARIWDINDTTGLMTLNAEVTRQAAGIAYVNDFLLVMYVMLAAAPILLFLKRPPRFPSTERSA